MKSKQLAWVDLESDPGKPKLRLTDKDQVNDFLAAHKHGQRIWVNLETYYPKRSLSQNNTLYWYIDLIAEETGYDHEFLKGLFAKKFLSVPVLNSEGNEVPDPETGEVLMKVLSTAKLTTVEFMEYTERIRVWCIEFLNFELPEPDRNIKLQLK